MLHKLLKDEAGFTLIELLIVVVIIGILAAVGIPIYSRYISSAKASEAATILGAVVEYVGSYARAHPEHVYDSGLLTAASNVCTPDNDNCTDDPDTEDGWMHEVIGSDNEYFNYFWSGNQASPTIIARGDGDPFSTTDYMTVTLGADGSTTSWLGYGDLADVTPD